MHDEDPPFRFYEATLLQQQQQQCIPDGGEIKESIADKMVLHLLRIDVDITIPSSEHLKRLSRQ